VKPQDHVEYFQCRVSHFSTCLLPNRLRQHFFVK